MLKLPEKLRAELSKPQGKLYRDGENVLKHVEELKRAKIAAFVGDVVTSCALKCRVKLDIAVIDGKTLRDRYKLEKLEGFEILNTKNPAGFITKELVETLKIAVDLALNGKRVCVFVEGEEDLAAIPLIILLPLKSVLIYGQPREGVVAVEITEEKKVQMLEFVKMMEKVGGDVFGNCS
ncbi:MAG: DUF359 domain-containing protein [Archaeoglobaceae archaeon]|nr:DUF359 domain-containing protein [Archaeoglobaceae archaeon]MCX8151645.1 DUF359 domain-containing protein [Archaeoglobaceae archaeon]MDW8013077.1 DUF359 domain-containing protein [Archaeoglobaceae archaeon]